MSLDTTRQRRRQQQWTTRTITITSNNNNNNGHDETIFCEESQKSSMIIRDDERQKTSTSRSSFITNSIIGLLCFTMTCFGIITQYYHHESVVYYNSAFGTTTRATRRGLLKTNVGRDDDGGGNIISSSSIPRPLMVQVSNNLIVCTKLPLLNITFIENNKEEEGENHFPDTNNSNNNKHNEQQILLKHKRNVTIDTKSYDRIKDANKHHRPRSAIRKPGCILLGREWQESSRPTCNNIHEINMKQFSLVEEDDHKKQQKIDTIKINSNETPSSTDDNSSNDEDDDDDDDDDNEKERKKQQQEEAMKKMKLKLINNGSFRDVWMYREDFLNVTDEAVSTGGGGGGNKVFALKTLRYVSKRYFDPKNYERHRRDAVAMEQLTSSPYVGDIYNFCGNTAVYEYADGGNLYDFIGMPEVVNVTTNPDDGEKYEHLINKHHKTLDHYDILKVAHRVAAAVGDAHHMEEEDRATIAHTDIKPDQFIKINGQYVLNDFNRARFLTWNNADEEPCKFNVSKNSGHWRAPEEYNYEPETEKIDVYSLGNVLYFMLTGYKPEEMMPNYTSMKDFHKEIASGIRPPFDEEMLDSNDLYYTAMIKAIRLCWEQDPIGRPDAKDIAKILFDALQKMSKESKRSEINR